MTENQSVEATSMTGETGELQRWETASELLGSRSSVWVATVRSDGRPHVMPVLPAWLDGNVYFSTSHSSQQARNLLQNPHSVVTVRDDRIELVVEGRVEQVTTEAELQRIAYRYHEQHGWDVEVRNGGFESEQKAPTAGEVPFIVFSIAPTRAFGLPVDGSFHPTRWRFA
jgi:nitroimidazol reductase NimA-like FMN-containing flavoprotein (pyridoxamine 5'-phosphate oxidase superfamily)